MNDLSPAASLAWKIAAAETGESRHAWIEPAHLLIGVLSLEKLAQLPESYARLEAEDRRAVDKESERLRDVLTQAALDASVWRRRLRGRLGIGLQAPSGRAIGRSPACKEAFQRAAVLAGAGATTSLHLLAALVEGGGGIIRASLEDAGVKPEALRAQTLAAERRAAPVSVAVQPPAAASRTPELDHYGRDLTRLAAEGQLGPVIGRRHEILRVIQTLARSSKNNPVLVGEAGVGKRTIVEALASRAAQGQDVVLGGKRIVELNLGALLAGTLHRGEFERRWQAILGELRNHPEVIVFLDQLHTVVGAERVGEGGMDAAALFKPALARGDFRCLGATTQSEYARYVESDPDLERCFERVLVEEPSREETLAILRGLRPRWEAQHGVRIDEEALLAALDLSLRFDPGHRLPAKAIDLVDQAAAQVLVPVLGVGAADEPPPFDRDAGAVAGQDRVTERGVVRVLADKLGLPLELLSEKPAGVRRSRLLAIEPFLRNRLIGQDDAVARVAQRLRLAHGGPLERRGPLAVFLFLGPSGVGKTELAGLLAEFLFGSEAELVRFDMSEFREEPSVAKLVGTPPGYLGHQEEGQLTRRLRANPYAVVLLDEVEKAHPRLFDVFSQVFDSGWFADARGRSADARNVIFAMTSNLGTESAREKVGFPGSEDRARSSALEEPRRFFPAEFLSRVDDILVFRALDENDALRVLRPLLVAVTEAVWRQHGVRLTIDPEAERFLARTGVSPAQGVRGLKPAVERLLQAPLAKLALEGRLAWHPAWRLVYDQGCTYLLPEEGGGP